jgi:2,3-dihydroxy-2,3-dihydrophenylpropionate dehydrogenase
MSGSLAGMSILVTGGGSGIGRAVTSGYVAAGAHVTVLERDPAAAEELVQAWPEAVSVVVGDATSLAAIDQAVAVASADGAGLHQLTCCVGVFDYYASVRDLEPEQLSAAAGEIWQVNVMSALLAVNRAYPLLRLSEGSVTLTLSESAFGAHGGGVLYGSSKWALRGVVAHLSADLAPEVRVNGVAPGGTVGTRLGGLDTLGQQQTADAVPGRAERIKAGTLLRVAPEPGDHMGAYMFLADRVASGVCTGVVINTDGGRS